MPQRQWLSSNVNDGPSGSVNQYINVSGAGQQSTWTSTDTDVFYTVPTDGQFRGFFLNRGTGPGAGATSTYKLRVNGTDSSTFVASVSNTSTSIREPFIYHNVSAGDRVCITHVPTLSPAASAPQTFSTWFCPKNPKEAVWLSNSGNSSLSGSTVYLGLGGQSFQAALEENISNIVTQVTGATNKVGTITKFYVHLSAAPASAASRTFYIRVNGVDNFTLTVSGAAVSASTTGSLDIFDGDLISIKATATASPTLARAYFGICYEPYAAGDYLTLGSSDDSLRATVGNEYHNMAVAGYTFSNTPGDRGQIPFWGTMFRGMGAAVTVAPGVGKERSFNIGRFTRAPEQYAVIIGSATYAKSSEFFAGFVPIYDSANPYTLIHRPIFASPASARGKWAIQQRSFLPISAMGAGFGC